MASPTGFRKLQRRELRAFDKRAQDLIMEAMERGGEGRVSTKGHAILRSPNGQTMSISRNTATGNRSYQNMQANFQSCFGDLEPQVPEQRVNGNGHEPLPVLPDKEPDLPCPLDSCDAVFITEGARYSHVHKEHYPCKEPGCQRVFEKPNQASGHYNIIHTREQLAKVPFECPVRTCDWKGTRAGFGGHKKVHPHLKRTASRKRKEVPKKKQVPAKAPEPRKPEPEPSSPTPDADERLAALEARVAHLEAALFRLQA